MKNSDVRSACIALIRYRVGGPQLAKAPRAAALGLHLERDEVAPHELSALCAAALGKVVPHGPLGWMMSAWNPSGPLRALLVEYRRAHRAEPRRPPNGCSAAGAVS